MYNNCCVVNCDSRRKDFNFHRFPKTEIELEKWLSCINSEKLRCLSLQELRKQFVCRKHFEKRFLSSTRERARLRPGSYPSLFSASEITSGIPRTAPRPVETNVINCDHDYPKKRKHVDHTYFKPQILKKHSKVDTEMEIRPSLIDNILPTSANGNEATDIDEIVYSTRTRIRRVVCKKYKLMPNWAKLYKQYIKSRRKLHFNQRAKKALHLI